MWRTAPFRKAPLLLFRQPAVLASIVGAGAILAMVAALTPLFLSSASSEALQRELTGRCSASFGGQTINFAPIPLARESLNDSVADDPVLGTPRLFLEGTLVDGQNADGSGVRTPIRFVARDEFREHITLISGSHGPGAYIDNYAADFMNLEPGGELMFTPAGGEPRTLPVTAVYEDIYGSQRHPYWCSLEEITLRNIQGELPPLIVLVDTEEFSDEPALFDSIFAQYARSLGDWEIPVETEGLTVSAARDAVATLELANEVIHEEAEEVPAFFGQPNLTSDLTIVSNRVETVTEALRTSILPLAGVVLFAALALVAGAGSYWVDRRSAELKYLSAAGVGPGPLAVKAGLETLPALVLAGGIGWVLANVLIGLIGPSSDIEVSARAQSAWVAALAIVAALLGLMFVVGARCRRILDRTRPKRHTIPWRIPLLIAAVAGAALVRMQIGETAVRTEENQLVGFVDPLVLFFPLFGFVAVVLLVAELLIRLFPAIRRAGRTSNSAYLASRRITSAPAVVLGLIAGAALPVATLVYAASLTRSATSTVDAKGRTFVGADVSTPVFGLSEIPDEIRDSSTVVVKTERASLNGETVDVLAIDTDTFSRGAFWDDAFADVELETVLEDLSQPAVDGALPAYVANGSVESGEILTRSGDVEVSIEGKIGVFPGSEASRILVIVDQDSYIDVIAPDGRLVGSRILLWTTGVEPAEIETSLSSEEVGFAYTLSADTALDQLKFAAVVWTFDFLEMYSALAGLIAIGGVLLYVDTRQRSRNLSYVLARRMGLQRREHLVAGILEIGGLALIGTLAGIAAATVGARSLYEVLDPVPTSPPGPLWVGALDIAAIAMVIATGVGIGAALLSQRTADTADAQELLSHGG